MDDLETFSGCGVDGVPAKRKLLKYILISSSAIGLPRT
jgi:hypothetical protein